MIVLIFFIIFLNGQSVFYFERPDEYYINVAKRYSREQNINIDVDGWNVYYRGYKDVDDYIKTKCTSYKTGLPIKHCPEKFQYYKNEYPNHPFISITFIFEPIKVKESDNMVLMGVINARKYYLTPNYTFYIDKIDDSYIIGQYTNKFK